MKRYLVFGAIGIALGLLIFATHVSEVLEWLVMGGVVLVPLSYLMSLISKGKKIYIKFTQDNIIMKKNVIMIDLIIACLSKD